MDDTTLDPPSCRIEITRLNKIIQALMNRAERSTNSRGSDFSLFQTTIMLEEQVRLRSEALSEALRENEKITQKLSESEAQFRGLVDQSLVGIAITENGKFSYTNAKFDAIFGYSSAEMRELGPIDLMREQERSAWAERMRDDINGPLDRKVSEVLRQRRKDGSEIIVELQGMTMAIGGKVALVGVVSDITARTRAEHDVQVLQNLLRDQSIHDALTGLYNRRFLDESLDRELILAARNGTCISVIMADLDHFKTVNDRYGHLAGDDVLRVFGELMKRKARASDIYCRYGGEEFLLVLPGMTAEAAVERSEQLRRALAETTVKFGAASVAVTASFGVATFPQDGKDRDKLVGAADTALYSAKAAGRNQVRRC